MTDKQMKNSIILQVRELLSKNLSMRQIASRLKINPDKVKIAVQIIRNKIA
jgi:DNA-binding CsgD family transcriptional regulator